MERLKSLGHSVVSIPRLELIELTKLMQQEKPDYIFHLAAYGNMSHQTDIQEIFKANVLNTWNMLLASKDVNYKGFINFGSSSEYGTKDKPMSEKDLPEAFTFYGASKIAGTYLARTFKSQKPVVTVRPFSVYGPGEADFRFIPTIMRSMINMARIKVSPGNHDWIYIDDFIDGVITVMQNAGKLDIVNIGTGTQYSNFRVLEIAEKVANKQAHYNYETEKLRLFDTDSWVADNSLLRSLGWQPKHTLEQGLQKTFEYYQSLYRV